MYFFNDGFGNRIFIEDNKKIWYKVADDRDSFVGVFFIRIWLLFRLLVLLVEILL